MSHQSSIHSKLRGKYINLRSHPLAFRLVVNDGTVNSTPSDTQVVLAPAPLAPGGSTEPPPQLRANGGFAFQLSALGTPGQPFQIQASTDLQHWIPIGTNSLTYLYRIPFVDTNAKLQPYRFYRALSLGP